jgi:phospholipid/cholesterol/gamma-HCH transport system permease protein
VVPRIIGITVSIVALTAYVIAFALGTGYLVGFLRGLQLRPGEFLGLIADALSWADFPLLALKSLGLGLLTSLIICYHGLAYPIRLEEVGHATTRTVAQCIVACLLLDAVFLLVYMFL